MQQGVQPAPRRLSDQPLRSLYWRAMRRVFLAVVTGLCCASNSELGAQSRKKKPPPAKPTDENFKNAQLSNAQPPRQWRQIGPRCQTATGTDAKNSTMVPLAPHRGVGRASTSTTVRCSPAELEQWDAPVSTCAGDGRGPRWHGAAAEHHAVADKPNLIDGMPSSAGPNGVKAVAPVSTEKVVVEVQEKAGVPWRRSGASAVARLEWEAKARSLWFATRRWSISRRGRRAARRREDDEVTADCGLRDAMNRRM